MPNKINIIKNIVITYFLATEVSAKAIFPIHSIIEEKIIRPARTWGVNSVEVPQIKLITFSINIKPHFLLMGMVNGQRAGKGMLPLMHLKSYMARGD